MSYINPTVQPPRVPSTLPLIRIAMTIGVLGFGAVIWFMTTRMGRVPPSPDTALTALMPYPLGLMLAGAIAMRFVAAKAVNPAQRAGYLIMGWAIGEAAALLGGAHWLLTGNPRFYLIGVFVFLSALVLLPLTRE